MDLGLKGKKAILAGASKGIGFATAKVLAGEGCDVAICSRSQDSVDAAVKTLSALGVKAFGAAVDASNSEAYRAWIDDAAKQLGGCDIFVPFPSGGGGQDTEEEWRKGLDLDIMVTHHGVHAALPHLRESKSGAIVAIASTAALEEFLGVMPYNAIKAAIIRYANSLAQNLAPEGIRVNTVSPGPVFIEGGAWDNIKEHMPELYEGTVAQVPMGRLGNGDEVARAIAFVASSACQFMNGANIVIDGCYTKGVQY